MKQLFLLLLIAASTVSVSAQRDYRDKDRHERYHYKDNRQDRHRIRDRHVKLNRKEYRHQVAMINRSFDARISEVKRHPFMRRRVKERKIQVLQLERRIALDQLKYRFSGKREYVKYRR